MLFRVHFMVLFSVCVLMVFAPALLSAQTVESSLSQSPDNKQNASKSHIGWGLSYAMSDILPNALTLNLSVVGGHTIAPMFELAVALHFNQSSTSSEIKGYHPVFQTKTSTFGVTSTYRIAYSVGGDITMLFIPFASSDTDWRNLRLGIGPSARMAGMMMSINGVNWDNGERIYRTQNTRQHNIGGHIVLEYLVQLSSSVDVSLRGHMVRFAPSFFTIGDQITISQNRDFEQNIFHTLQLGAFLRINF